MGERVLVLGASGFLGSVVFAKFREQSNIDVLGTAFNRYHHKNLKYLNVYDTRSVELLLQNFKPNVIVWCLMHMVKEDELTAVGLKNILENTSSSVQIIYISTDAFKGDAGNYSEEVPMPYWDKCHAGATYVNGKLDAERMILGRANSTVIRTGPLYGQNAMGKWDKRTSRLLEAISKDEILVLSDNLYKTFVHVEDLADLIAEIMNQRATGIFHAGPEEKESYYSFHHKMAVRLGLDQSLITAYSISQQEAVEKGLTLDTSMNTEKVRKHFKIRFRTVEY